MANYLDIQKEETLKAAVFHDYFDNAKFAYEPNIGNIDFIVTDAKLAAGGLFKAHYLWAEAKKGEVDEVSMMTQLVLTCKKTYDSGEFMPPPYLGCFDGKKIGFLPFHDILPIFAENDINWNAAPSNYLSCDFIKTRKKITKLLAKNFTVFDFDGDSAEIKSFIKNNFIPGASSAKSPITKNNFPHIYNRWLKEVKPTINLSAERWLRYKKEGVLDCDFFRADMMSKDGTTITERLQIVLENDKYKLQKDIEGELFKADINFTDGGAAYKRFWNKYERPPAEEYQQYIIDRRDLLVPQNIREVKGSFFTPQIWVEKSQEYIAKALGENWQDEYVIWDCAAGTGNLLAGLANKYNIWASTIDQPDVDTMKALIDEGLNLLHDHVFQFDFLNDSFDKLPAELKKITSDPERRKKLIVYINPPYAEATSTATAMGRGRNKGEVATAHKTRDKYQAAIGSATNEISAQFMARVYREIPKCKLALFSKLKFVNGQNFSRFREFFNADFKKGFVVCADTFDNVAGKFPIGFTVWDLSGKKCPKNITLDVAGTREKKRFWALDGKSINKWIIQFNKTVHEGIAYMANPAPDFQKINQPYITAQTGSRHFHYYVFNKSNVIEGCIYFAVRLCIEPTWLNDRDQFLFPNDGYKTDTEFQSDCLIFTLFHGQNRISSRAGVNHWIPFTEQEVDASEKFDSNFMSKYIKGKMFSNDADSVLKAGLELWKYYHAKTKGNNTVSVNASFYDIREYFQGRSTNGKMNNKSADETYNKIIKTLRNNVKLLARKIEPKIYEYGFLRENCTVSPTQLDSNTAIQEFLCSTIVSIGKYHTLNNEILKNSPSFIFTDAEHYGEEIHKIDPNAEYTDDGINKGVGKTIFKDGKTFIIINSLILDALIQSEYKNVICRYVIYHELGHWVTYMLNPEFIPGEKPYHSISMRDCSKYLYSIAIDEYMANNYIIFLLSENDCVEILSTNTLYTDIENLYTNICDTFDLFNRFWNSPNAIFKNLFENIPFFEKIGSLKENETLKILNIKGLMAALSKSKPQFDIIYQDLVETFNIIVADYNSDNPLIQKPIR